MGVGKKIVLWCADAPNQKALANKIHATYGLAGMIIEQRKPSGKKKKKSIVSKAIDFFRFRSMHYAWHGLQYIYNKKYKSWPQAPSTFVESINSDIAYDFTKNIGPDLIVVSGTGLVKDKMLSIPSEIGIINLHTGLSPYIKGGPNCTNWCIANNDWHLIGNTIMWINAGIDTGNIITTETIDIRDSKSLLQAHFSVMEHAHDLYLKAINYLLENKPPFNSVVQNELGQGQLFLNKMWDDSKKIQLIKNWRNRKKIVMKPFPKTISLP